MDNKIELGVVPEKEYKIVPDAQVARKLLRDGYKIEDIKPKRGSVKETIFVFEVADGFMDKLDQYTKEFNAKFSKRREDK